MMWGLDPLYLIMSLPALVLALIASGLTKSTFARYSRVRASSGMTGAEAARHLLDAHGLQSVRVEETGGFLGDHYDPMSRTLRLSHDVYASPSLSAIGVACHEAGHALQHAARYLPLWIRTALVPVAQLGTMASYIIIPLGFIMGALGLIKIGIILFSVVVLFSIITLPVEWNASSRAKQLMVTAGIVSPGEAVHAGRVLNAAFLTYVAAVISALMTLLYYLLRAGLLGGRSNDD